MMLSSEHNAYLATIVIATLFIVKKIRWMSPESCRLWDRWCCTALSSWRSTFDTRNIYASCVSEKTLAKQSLNRTRNPLLKIDRDREQLNARTRFERFLSTMTSWRARQSTNGEFEISKEARNRLSKRRVAADEKVIGYARWFFNMIGSFLCKKMYQVYSIVLSLSPVFIVLPYFKGERNFHEGFLNSSKSFCFMNWSQNPKEGIF